MLERQRPENGEIIGEVVEPKPSSGTDCVISRRTAAATSISATRPLPHLAQDCPQ